MEQDNIVDFVCLRIQAELDKFARNNSLPSSLMDGAFSIDDIDRCWHTLSGEQKVSARKLQNLYSYQIRENHETFMEAFHKDYHELLKNLKTQDNKFQFPGVLIRYRTGINPVTALFYEVRYAMRNYDPTSEYHDWLHCLITDNDFSNTLQDSLGHDIGILDCILNRYYVPLQSNDMNIPLELMHAREMIKRFKYYVRFFRKSRTWNPS